MSKEVTSADVMALRKQTGVGMGKCKEALLEANGDREEAIHILRKRGIASAIKKGSRQTNEGVIGYIENEMSVFVVEVHVETDFVLQNDRFKEFLANICEEGVNSLPESVDLFLQKKYSQNPSLTIDEYRAETIHSLGENIQLGRLMHFQKGKEQSIGLYSHMGGKIVSVVLLRGAGDQVPLTRDIAMHVAAASPDYLDRTDVPTALKEKEEDIARSQIQNKPPQIVDKIIEGKLKAYYAQNCLLCQHYVKDSSITIRQLVEQAGKKAGKPLAISKFIRWQIGD